MIEELTDCIFHFHAKDSMIYESNARRNGVLDPKGYGEMAKRSWNFRTVGYGHSEEVWKNIMSCLASAGYDYVVSIEHEDSLMDREEGFSKAVRFLKNVMISKRPRKNVVGNACGRLRRRLKKANSPKKSRFLKPAFLYFFSNVMLSPMEGREKGIISL